MDGAGIEPASLLRCTSAVFQPLALTVQESSKLRNVEAYVFGSLDARHVVVLKIIVCSLWVLMDQWTLKNMLPHFVEFCTGCQFSPMITVLLPKSVDNTRVLSINGLVYCVVHI